MSGAGVVSGLAPQVGAYSLCSVSLRHPIRGISRVGESILDRVLCVAGAVAFSQGPEFIQQYAQRLGGRLDEARRQLQAFTDAATQAGGTLDGLVAAAGSSTDAGLVKVGAVIAASPARVAELEAAERAIREASPATRPFVFAQHYDGEIARSTLSVFQPAVPTTIEGLCYALVGMVVALALYHGLVRRPLAAVWSRLSGGAGRQAPARAAAR